MSTNWIALLGVKGGPAIRPGSSMPTSTLLEIGDRRILVDAGLGTARAVCEQGVALTALDLIIVTHLHSDHYLELGPLLHTAWTAGLTRPIPVIGPYGLRDYWTRFLASMNFDIALRIEDEGRVALSDLADISQIIEGTIFSEGGLEIRAIRNNHPPIADSFGLAFFSEGQKLVLSGDTAPFEGWIEFVRGADMLVHEAMLPAGVDAVIAGLAHPDPRLKEHILAAHTAVETVGEIAAAADIGHLVLNHFVPEGLPGFGVEAWEDAVRQSWQGKLTLGRDGMRLPVVDG